MMNFPTLTAQIIFRFHFSQERKKTCRAKGKLPYAVIEKYLGSAFGKRVSDSAVKQKKDEYDAVRKSLGERWVL